MYSPSLIEQFDYQNFEPLFFVDFIYDRLKADLTQNTAVLDGIFKLLVVILLIYI